VSSVIILLVGGCRQPPNPLLSPANVCRSVPLAFPVGLVTVWRRWRFGFYLRLFTPFQVTLTPPNTDCLLTLDSMMGMLFVPTKWSQFLWGLRKCWKKGNKTQPSSYSETSGNELKCVSHPPLKTVSWIHTQDTSRCKFTFVGLPISLLIYFTHSYSSTSLLIIH